MLAWIKEKFLRTHSCYREVFNTRAGQIVLRDLFLQAGMGRSPQAPGDPYGTHVNIGKQFVGLHIASQLGMTPDQVIAAVQQAKAHDQEQE